MSHPVVFLCTGNAARSVMGGAALAAHLPDWHVTTAGTLVVEGQPMSWRTKAALGVGGPRGASHRSRQATEAEMRHAALVIALAPEHVHGCAHPPEAAPRTATCGAWRATCRPTTRAARSGRVARPRRVELGDWEEVVTRRRRCRGLRRLRREVVDLVAALAPRLVGR